MSVLPKYYTTLRQGVTEALTELDSQNCKKAKEILVHALQNAEGLYILVDEWTMTTGAEGIKTPH